MTSYCTSYMEAYRSPHERHKPPVIKIRSPHEIPVVTIAQLRTENSKLRTQNIDLSQKVTRLRALLSERKRRPPPINLSLLEPIDISSS